MQVNAGLCDCQSNWLTLGLHTLASLSLVAILSWVGFWVKGFGSIIIYALHSRSLMTVLGYCLELHSAGWGRSRGSSQDVLEALIFAQDSSMLKWIGRHMVSSHYTVHMLLMC